MSKHSKIHIQIGVLFGLLFAVSSSAIANIDATSYVGTWKGTTYGGNGTFPDITMTLNEDGSYSCSGYPASTGVSSTDKVTPWRVICETPAGQTNKWELVLPTFIRYTHNNSTKIAPMSLVSIASFDGKTLVLELPTLSSGSSSASDSSGGYSVSESTSLTIAEFTKQ